MVQNNTVQLLCNIRHHSGYKDTMTMLLIPLNNRGSSPSIIGGFRFQYKCEINYENDFSILVFRLRIVASHT